MLPKVGQTIELTQMLNDPDPIPVGTRGVVTGVYPMPYNETQISMDWENGRTLSLILPHDKFIVIEGE